MRIARHLLGVAGALLVTFHGWLLAGQYLDGQLVEPWLVLRWVVATALVSSLVTIRRQGFGFFSRRSVAVWVLAALLHGPAVVGHYGAVLNSVAVTESVATVGLQIAAAAALGLVLLIVASLLARRQRRPVRLTPFAFGFHPAGAFAGAYPPPFSPRPPPVA